MDEAGDIVGISVPLTAGVAAAAVLAEPEYSAAISSVAVAAATVWCVVASGRSRIAVSIMVFCLGVMCWSTWSLLGGGATEGPLKRLAGSALEAFTGLLDSIPFRNTETGALIKALLTGQKGDLSRDTITAFRASGASHILALSGLHLGVIYLLLGKMLSPLGNSPVGAAVRSVTIIIASAFYTVMTGAAPSIVRAFLFITINEALKLDRRRKRNPIGVLCLALTIQLSLAPGVIKSAGFQLSYLAMAGIFLLFPWMDSWYPDSGKPDPMRKIWSSAALSISCQLFTAPVAWLRFHTFPKYFLITNLIALPLSQAIMTSAVATVVLTALGICPPILVRATEFLAEVLEFCLSAISSIQTT